MYDITISKNVFNEIPVSAMPRKNSRHYR